jgi:N-acetylmuramoyl-L-alanine amidase
VAGTCALHAVVIVAALTVVGPAATSSAADVRATTSTTGTTSTTAITDTTANPPPATPPPPPTPPAPPPPPPPLKGKVIVVDPGHNGRNWKYPRRVNRKVWAGNMRKACDTTGTATNGGYSEAAFTWDVARRLARQLRKRGATVRLTRRNNRGVGPCITRRAAIGNRAKADAAISIHADGGPPTGRGFHVIRPRRIAGLTDDIAGPSRRLAMRVRASLDAIGIARANYIGHRGVDVRGDLGGLNLSNVPKVFVELGNMRNARDARRLRRARHRQKIAVALANAIERQLT